MGVKEDFINKAFADTSEGDHEAILFSVETKQWPDGTSFKRVTVQLPESAGGGKADCNINPTPTDEYLKIVESEGNKRKMQGIAAGMQLVSQLQEHYGTDDPDRLTIGMPICVKTKRDKVTENPITGAKKGGFLRIRAFLPPGSVKINVGPSAAPSTVPF